MQILSDKCLEDFELRLHTDLVHLFIIEWDLILFVHDYPQNIKRVFKTMAQSIKEYPHLIPRS